jgi:hypothetical protein
VERAWVRHGRRDGAVVAPGQQEEELSCAGLANLTKSFALKSVRFDDGLLMNLLAGSRDPALPDLSPAQVDAPLCSGAGEHQLEAALPILLLPSDLHAALKLGEDLPEEECFSCCLNCGCLVHRGSAMSEKVVCARGGGPHILMPTEIDADPPPRFQIRWSTKIPEVAPLSASAPGASAIQSRSDWRRCLRCACLFHEHDTHNRMCAAGSLDDSVAVDSYSAPHMYYQVDHEPAVAPRGAVDDGVRRCSRCDVLVDTKQIRRVAAKPQHDALKLLLAPNQEVKLQKLVTHGSAATPANVQLSLRRLAFLLLKASWASSSLHTLELLDLNLRSGPPSHGGTLRSLFTSLARCALPLLHSFSWSSVIEPPLPPNEFTINLSGSQMASAGSLAEKASETFQPPEVLSPAATWTKFLFTGQSRRAIKVPSRLTAFTLTAAPQVQGTPPPMVTVSSWRPTDLGGDHGTKWTRVHSFTPSATASAEEGGRIVPAESPVSRSIKTGRWEGHMLLMDGSSLEPLWQLWEIERVTPLEGEPSMVDVEGFVTVTSPDKTKTGRARLRGQVMDTTFNLSIQEVVSGEIAQGQYIGQIEGDTFTGLFSGGLIGQIQLRYSAQQSQSITLSFSLPISSQWTLLPGDVLALSAPNVSTGASVLGYRESDQSHHAVVMFTGLKGGEPDPAAAVPAEESKESQSEVSLVAPKVNDASSKSMLVNPLLQRQFPVRFTLVESEQDAVAPASNKGARPGTAKVASFHGYSYDESLSSVQRFLSSVSKQLTSLSINVQSTPNLPLFAANEIVMRESSQQDVMSQVFAVLPEFTRLERLQLVAPLSAHHLPLLQGMGRVTTLREVYLRLPQTFNLPLPSKKDAPLLRHAGQEDIDPTADTFPNWNEQNLTTWPKTLQCKEHKHPLQQRARVYRGQYQCNFCGREGSSYVFHCDSCNFDMVRCQPGSMRL